MKIGTGAFGGMAPRLEPHLLSDQQAQVAQNCKLWTGSLEPRHQNFLSATLAKPGTKLSIYRFGANVDSDANYWFHWLNDTDVARGPIPDDPNERTYYTEAGQPPKVTDSSLALGAGGAYPTNAYLLGIPSPDLTALVTVTGSATDSTAVPQSTVVVYTYVSAWGEEGAPNVASTPVEVSDGQTLTVSNMSGPPAGAYNIVSKRVYVSSTASGVTNFRFWKEIAVGTSSVSDVFTTASLAEDIPSPYLALPPSDLFGLVAHPNGFLVGLSGKKVCRSELNRPHGWPDEYQDPVASDLVGCGIVGASVVLCATAATYLMTGSDPLNMTIEQVPLAQPCVSKRSIVSTDGGVLYSSPDGLVQVTGDGVASIITAPIFTPEQWQAFKPETINAYFFKGAYVAFFNNGTTQAGFVIDSATSSVYLLDFYATAGYADPRRNALFLVVAGIVYKFDTPQGQGRATLIWRSKRYFNERQKPFIAAKVIATAYPWTLKLYVDGRLRHTQLVSGREAFTMRSDYLGRDVEYEISGNTDGRVQEIVIGGSKIELGL